MDSAIIALLAFGFGYFFGKNRIVSQKQIGIPIVSQVGPRLFASQTKRKPVSHNEKELWEKEQANHRST